MGGKPRARTDVVTLARRLAQLQELVARQEVIAADAKAALAESSASLKETHAALLAAAKNGDAAIAASIKSPRLAKAKKTRTRAKAKPAAHWEARQAALIKAMKAGTLYDSAQLQELSGCAKEAKHVFATNVRKPLLAAKKIKKTRIDKANRSPRAVRWIRN